MTKNLNLSTCEGCGAILPIIDGPIHPYMLSSASCWESYGEILAREYENPDYFKIHRLTVDAYALQHPGGDDRRAIQSVNVHLASLYLIFEKNLSFEQATKKLANIVKNNKIHFKALKTPSNNSYNITVIDILKAKDVDQHIDMVTTWAKEVFQKWGDHHETVNQLLSKAW